MDFSFQFKFVIKYLKSYCIMSYNNKNSIFIGFNIQEYILEKNNIKVHTNEKN